MISAEQWAGGDHDRCKHGKENLDECPEDCYLNFIRTIQANAMAEAVVIVNSVTDKTHAAQAVYDRMREIEGSVKK